MKMIQLLFRAFIIMILGLFIFTACEFLEQEPPPTPTKTLMEGVWRVVSATDMTTGDTITKRISFPICAFHLSSDNTVISTSGPFTTYLVYGDSKWTEVSSKFDQVFNYVSLSFNGGEFFVGDGVVDRFTLEMKLEGVGGTKTLSDILQIFKIEAQWLKTVVYHKFINVEVIIDQDYPTIMDWEFDESTTTQYNMKDNQGNYVLWQGFTSPFRQCKVTLFKESKDLEEIIKEAGN